MRGDRVRALELGCGEIANADVPGLSLRDKVVESAQRFIEWRQGIAVVELPPLARSTWFSVPLRPSLRPRILVCRLSGELEWKK
jgi:hypothetical protein